MRGPGELGEDDRRRAASGSEADAEAHHWRELAEERDAALRSLTRRPLVRAALLVERRAQPMFRRTAGWRDAAGTGRARAALAVRSVGARSQRRRRRLALARLGAAAGPAPVVEATAAVVALGDPGDIAASGVSGTAAVRVNPAAGEPPRMALARAAAVDADVVCFAPRPVEALTSGWLARLVAALGGATVASTPTLVHPERHGWATTADDQRVRAEGFELTLDPAGVPVASARHRGRPLDPRRPPAGVVLAPLQGLVVDRAALEAVGGLIDLGDDDASAADLCQRLRAAGGRIVHVPGAAVVDRRPVRTQQDLVVPVDPTSAGWRAFVERNGPAAVRQIEPRSAAATRWVITTAVPSARIASRWGDWHLAEAMARSLRALGQDVVVQTHDQADSLAARSRDVHLVLRGLAPVRRTPGQGHIVWVVSHPEAFDAAERDAADLVVVASERFADHLREGSATPVEVLLQATDPTRFHPCPPTTEHQHPVTVVAKTRNILRPIVADALAAGLRPAIYGGGWEHLVDPALVVADHVDNQELPVVYSSAGVVLNDHWDTMAAWGFVSNRIFDVLACGAPIISDDVPTIPELFGGAVPTYRSVDELGALVRDMLKDPVAARARAAIGRAEVLEHHTFDHRAAELLELARRHGVDGLAEVTPA